MSTAQHRAFAAATPILVGIINNQLQRRVSGGLDQMRNRRAALGYAREIGGEVGRLTFPDATVRFIVFKGDRPKTVMPAFRGDLSSVLADLSEPLKVVDARTHATRMLAPEKLHLRPAKGDRAR